MSSHLTSHICIFQCAKRQFGALDFACLQLVEYLLELLYLFFGGGPGGDETADGVVVVGLTEMGEGDALGQALGNGIGEYNELLIGGGIDIESETATLEKLLHEKGHLNGMTREGEVEGLF